MDSATEARIVDIELPLANNSCAYFTGYILSDGLILTCLHGFTDDPDYDSESDSKITIQSSNLDVEIPLKSTCFSELVKDEFFAYYGEELSEKFDVVIFKCPAAKANNPQVLQLARFDSRGDWEGGGYPYFNRNNEATNGYQNFDGTFTTSSKAINLELEVSLKLPNMEDWGCASGSPVFIRGKLAGIIRRYRI